MTNPLIEPTKVIIPVSTAVERTANWRNFLKNKMDVKDPRKMPKAVYISRADIEALAASCQADDTIVGARAYFTLTTPDVEEIKNEVKFVMVLVKESETKPFGEDIVYLPGSVGGRDDDSNVYDFTRPCPDCCDITSPLFGGGE
jgi:hypothetical protein